MSTTVVSSTTINGALVSTDRITIVETGSSSEDILAFLDERHALASGGYDNVGDVVVVTMIENSDEHPALADITREWRS